MYSTLALKSRKRQQTARTMQSAFTTCSKRSAGWGCIVDCLRMKNMGIMRCFCMNNPRSAATQGSLSDLLRWNNKPVSTKDAISGHFLFGVHVLKMPRNRLSTVFRDSFPRAFFAVHFRRNVLGHWAFSVTSPLWNKSKDKEVQVEIVITASKSSLYNNLLGVFLLYESLNRFPKSKENKFTTEARVPLRYVWANTCGANLA